MADITKCTGEGCPFKETCYRYTASSGMRQSFFVAPPYKKIDSGEGGCDYYWDILPKKTKTSGKEKKATNE